MTSFIRIIYLSCTWNPLLSTFVEHHGVSNSFGLVPCFVQAVWRINDAEVKGNMHFMPELGPATVMQLPDGRELGGIGEGVGGFN